MFFILLSLLLSIFICTQKLEMFNGYESECDDIIATTKPRVKLFRKTKKRACTLLLNTKPHTDFTSLLTKLKALAISRTSPHRFNRLFTHANNL
jgi:hypothetical protein